MNKCHRIIGYIILVAMYVLAIVNIAFATSIILPGEDDFIKNADRIVMGTVSAITSYDTTDGLRTVIDITVSDPIKGGGIPGDTLAVRELGGKVNNNVMFIPGSPNYHVGERVMVIAKLRPDGSYRTSLMDAGRIPVLPDGVAKSTSATDDVLSKFKDAVAARVNATKTELKKLPATAKAESLAVVPAPLSGPAESQTEFRFMTDPPSRWMNQPISVYGDPIGDSKLGYAPSHTAMLAGFAAWSGAGQVDFSFKGDQPAVGYACQPGKLIVQFRDVKNDIEAPNGCSGVLAIGGFCDGGMLNGIYNISAGALVFADGWENCDFWNADNVTEVMTHELGHTLGLAHSCESTDKICDSAHSAATMNWMAHFDGRKNGLKDYDKGAIAALYGARSGTPTPVGSSTPVATATPTPTAKPNPTTTAPSPFYQVQSLSLTGSLNANNTGYLSVKMVVNETIVKGNIMVLLFNGGLNKYQSYSNMSNAQINGNQITFRINNVQANSISTNSKAYVIVGSKIGVSDVTCVAKPGPNTLLVTCK